MSASLDKWNMTAALACGAAALALAAGALAADKRDWKPLAEGGVHDPASPAITQLQAPGTALLRLPPGTGGNLVEWGEALRWGLIAPLAGADPKSGTESMVLDQDVLLSRNGSLPPVLFPHLDHTQLLDCGNCHDDLFKMQAGANQLSMLRILRGEQCGVCHGAVAFPLTECKRCHNASWDAVPASAGK